MLRPKYADNKSHAHDTQKM